MWLARAVFYPILLAIALIILSGCAPGFQVRQNPYQDPRLAAHVQTFENVYRVPADLPITIMPLENNWAGVCRYGSNTRIEIDEPYYLEYANYYNAIEQLMMHEFGHCVLHLDHDDRYFTDGPMAGCPVSILNSYTFPGYCYDTFRRYYLEEMGAKAGIVANLNDI
jgi:hypothetical protein